MRATLVPHVSRACFWLAVLGAAAALDLPLVVLGASAALYLACFALFHDAAHGALGLPRRANDALLFALSAPLFMSTHAQRQLHMRHHARPLADDDVEGIGARLSFARALVTSPLLVGGTVVEGLRAVPAKLRALVVLEWGAVLAIALAAVAGPTTALACFVLVAVVMQLGIGLWASHIPHNPPAPLVAAARALLAALPFRSPVVLSLVLHREHHAAPRVPCARLAGLAPLAPLTAR